MSERSAITILELKVNGEERSSVIMLTIFLLAIAVVVVVAVDASEDGRSGKMGYGDRNEERDFVVDSVADVVNSDNDCWFKIERLWEERRRHGRGRRQDRMEEDEDDATRSISSGEK